MKLDEEKKTGREQASQYRKKLKQNDKEVQERGKNLAIKKTGSYFFCSNGSKSVIELVLHSPHRRKDRKKALYCSV